MITYAFHGFLGRPADWDCFNIASQIHAIDLFDAKTFNHHQSLHECAQGLRISNNGNKNILLGYSLGGRMALHLLLQQPELWDAAIFVSTHPGIQDKNEKHQRQTRDHAWAKRFEMEPWDTLLQDWHAQDVFGGHRVERKENQFNRQILSDVLRNWSLGAQDFLLPFLKDVAVPILWIAGEKDHRYSEQARSLSLKHPLSKVWISPNVAHRVPWEAPELFQNEVNQFLIELNQRNL
jgi:2-succinyl-6-hydroxy-2,4-cyclohexadiene-1-carboxylate synthase